jgi:hypothetical protein
LWCCCCYCCCVSLDVAPLVLMRLATYNTL